MKNNTAHAHIDALLAELIDTRDELNNARRDLAGHENDAALKKAFDNALDNALAGYDAALAALVDVIVAA